MPNLISVIFKLILTFFILLPSISFADKEFYHELTTKRGATQPLWIIERDNAAATLVLFAGGKGKLKISEDGIRKKKNFLIRSRNKFADMGFNVVVVDKPRDLGGLFDFRITEDHANDIQTVIKFIKKEYKKPVWLIGTSRGTLSAANAAARLHGENGPDGIVLTASVVLSFKHDSLYDVKLKYIRVPTLLVHNKDDGCKVCPYYEVVNIVAEFVRVRDKALLSYQGGYDEHANPCKGMTKHGFLGLENKVVADIVDWIKPRLKN